jgi:hypothetical protein
VEEYNRKNDANMRCISVVQNGARFRTCELTIDLATAGECVDCSKTHYCTDWRRARKLNRFGHGRGKKLPNI